MKEDPRDKLTNFITTGGKSPEEKTRIMCKEQAEFYYAYLNLGAEPGLEFFKEEAERDMRLMMSLEGKRSDDIVEMFKHIDRTDMFDVGLQPITDYNKSRREKRDK